MVRTFVVTAAAVFLVTACSPEDATAPDAAPYSPDADLSGQPQTLVDGLYELEWTCVKGCLYNAPFKAGLDGLTVAAGQVSYTSSCCTVATERAYEVLAADGGCVAMPGLYAGADDMTQPYSFCGAVGGPVAKIEWKTFHEQPVEYILQALPR